MYNPAPGGVCQIHFVLADQLFGGPDPHLAEVFDGAPVRSVPGISAVMSAADGELPADLLILTFSEMCAA